MTPSAGLELLRPALLAVALAALPLFAVALYGRAARRRERALLVAPRHTARFLPGHSDGRALVRIALAALALVWLGLALAGPVRGWTMRNVTRRGLDLVVCIDTSNSMLVRDIRPDRLTRALREVSGLIDRLRGDRMALIAFSGEPREVAPLTHDRTTLQELLKRVTPEDNTLGGTSLGAALSAALAMFDGRTGAHEAVVMLTDGEDLAGEGLAVARTAAERGIRVYVVGMGTEMGGKIPLVDADGQERFLTDDEGGEVVSALSGETLEELARTTGGEYLAAVRSPAPLEELYQMRIARLEGRNLDGTEWVPHDRYQWALGLALACMLLEAGLRERRVAALFLAWPGLGGAGAVDLAELARSSRAGQHERALELADALAAEASLAELDEVERAEVLYAVGVARHAADARESAAEAFLTARDLAGPGELRGDAAYNVAAILLEAAEEARLAIPELAEAAGPGGPAVSPGPTGGALPAPPAAVPGAPGAPEGPDPLDLAEAAYRMAREAHLDRVRLGAPDADTRANLELVQRRLRELEELRKQREEEQQQNEQQQGQPDESQGEQEPQDSPPQDSGEQSPEEQPPEGSEEQEQEPEDPAEGESQESDEQPPEEKPSEEDQADEQQDEGEEREAEPTPAEEAEEHLMSREEVLRLLDQLAEIEEEGREVRRALVQKRRVPVERDW